jgi:hypothetical protein
MKLYQKTSRVIIPAITLSFRCRSPLSSISRRLFSSAPFILTALVSWLTLRVSATEAIYSYSNVPTVVGYARGGAGFAFQPLTSISITSLGFGGSDITNESYQVTLWNSTGTQLASTTVTTADPFLNQTWYGTVTPVTLSAGQTYYLGATGVDSGMWLGSALILPPNMEANGTISVSPDISYLAGATSMGINAGIPIATDATAFYINANFQYTIVPEPSMLCLYVLALVSVLPMRSRSVFIKKS